MADGDEDKAVPPVLPIDVNPHGGGFQERPDPSYGACGIGEHPCWHKALDLIAKKGTVVHAPHDGWVWVSQPWSNEKPWRAPFAGYGPAIVLLAHDDGEPSGALNLRNQRTKTWSLLAHLDPTQLRYEHLWSDVMVPGDAKSKSGTELWEKTGPNAYTASTYGADTPEAFADLFTDARYVHKGEWLGKVGDMGHVHWEIRHAPLGGSEISPFAWLDSYSRRDWTQTPPPKSWGVKPSGGETSPLVVAGLLWAAYEVLK